MHSKTTKTLFFLLLLLCSTNLFAGEIKGRVIDAKTGESLIGASVELEGKIERKTSVNLDGFFVFKNIPAGDYEIEVSFLGYKKIHEIKVSVKDENDIKLLQEIAMEDDIKNLDSIVVTSSGGVGTDKSVRNMEKNSDYVQNILSQRSIELSPDVTTANALQRISGITIQRNSDGEGRYAIIRGMDQRYNTTLVNGIKIPSPDDKYRYVPMDLFPSELLERIEVIKALTPNMEGDAIGGVTNLVMKSAPDKFLLTANASAGYSFLFSSRPFSAFDHTGINKQSPDQIYGSNYNATSANFTLNNLHYNNLSAPVSNTIGLTIGDRFLNKRLGVIVAAAYQDFYKGANSDFFVLSSQGTPTLSGGLPQFTDAETRQFSTQTRRLAINNKIDYILNTKNVISLYNFFVHQDDYQTRFTQDTTYGTNSSGSNKSVDIEYRSKWQIQDIYSTTLQGQHELSKKISINWSGVYSLAKNQIPDLSGYDYNDEVTLDGSGKVVKDSLTTYGLNVKHSWQYNTDQDIAGYANIIYKPHFLGKDMDVEAGGLYRYKTRTNYYADYSLSPSSAYYNTTEPYHSLDTIPLAFLNPPNGGLGSVATTLHNDVYTAHEHIMAGYLQDKFMINSRLQFLGGVRIENTQQDYLITNASIYLPGRQGTINYVDILPSVHLKYALSSKQNLRVSYFKSISRPGFGDLVPSNYPSDDGAYNTQGNPFVLHTVADNYDVRYELFPGHADQLLIGGFYKNLQDPIEYYVQSQGNSTSSLIIEPKNPLSAATNFGFEAVFTKYFGKFGVAFNYTYTHSQVTTTKLIYYISSKTNQDTTSLTTQTRPLQGQAANIGNLSLLFKDPKSGFDLQLALAYTGNFIVQVSPYYNQDYWQKAYAQLDFSMEKTLTKHFALYGKVNNLLNSVHKEYLKFSVNQTSQGNGNVAIPFQDQNNGNNTIVQRDMYKTSFLAGIKFKF